MSLCKRASVYVTTRLVLQRHRISPATMTSAADRAEVRGQHDLEDDMRPRARLYMCSPVLIRPIFGPGPRHGEYGLNDIFQNYPLLNVIHFVLMLDKIHVPHLKLCQISFIMNFLDVRIIK